MRSSREAASHTAHPCSAAPPTTKPPGLAPPAFRRRTRSRRPSRGSRTWSSGKATATSRPRLRRPAPACGVSMPRRSDYPPRTGSAPVPATQPQPRTRSQPGGGCQPKLGRLSIADGSTIPGPLSREEQQYARMRNPVRNDHRKPVFPDAIPPPLRGQSQAMDRAAAVARAPLEFPIVRIIAVSQIGAEQVFRRTDGIAAETAGAKEEACPQRKPQNRKMSQHDIEYVPPKDTTRDRSARRAPPARRATGSPDSVPAELSLQFRVAELRRVAEPYDPPRASNSTAKEQIARHRPRTSGSRRRAPQ